VLADLGLDELALDGRLLHLLNKADLIDQAQYETLENMFPTAVFVSAKEGVGVDTAIEKIEQHLLRQSSHFAVKIPVSAGAARAWLYQHAAITGSSFDESGAETLTVRISSANRSRFLVRWPELIQPGSRPQKAG